MTAYDYTKIAATASRLIARFGKDVTITKTTGDTLDPVLGAKSGGTTSTQTVKAVVTPATGGKIQALDLRYNLQGMTYERLSFFVVAGNDLTFIPESGMTVTVESEVWTIFGVTAVNPNSGTGITYEIAIRI